MSEPCGTGSLIMPTQQLIHYNLDITAVQTTSWQDKHNGYKNTKFLFVVGKKGENMSM